GPTGPLSDLVVVDLSTGIAGAYATKLLADGGARVTKLEPPEGDPLRRWSASGTDLPDDVDGALFRFLAASKASVAAEPESGLGRGAPDWPPVFVGGQVGEWLTGTYAAIGTMASRTGNRCDAPGELVDLSVLEVLALCLTYYPVTYAEMVGRPFRTGRSIVTP